MALQVVGAGLPRTATASLGIALKHLLGGEIYHMSIIPGHPFDLGPAWDQALGGDTPDWDQLFDGYIAAMDWPASMFYQELSEAYPGALVLLSMRDSAETWLQSAEATFLPVARMALEPDWEDGRGLVDLLERFTGSELWDNPAVLMTAYERHNGEVRQGVSQERLIEWGPGDGWSPLCRALDLPQPDMPFPWVNRREDWGKSLNYGGVMTAQVQTEHFTNALYMLLDEVFDNVHGYILDRGTSMFDTLATISAEEASIPVGGKCATLAAQVKHVAFYLDVLERAVLSGTNERVDWGEIWRTTKEVTPSEWEALKAGLRDSYDHIKNLIHDTPAWPSEKEIGGAIAVIAHTAYHLGEIRQALCTLKK